MFPAGAVPENRIHKLSSICSFGDTPLVVGGALVQILQQHFADTDNLESARLRAIITREGPWREGNLDNGIYIESIQNWRPELTQTRPAIIVRDGDWQWQRMGIGNQEGVEEDTGKAFFSGFWFGAHSVFAIGKDGGEVKIIAGEIAKTLLRFGQFIADQLEMHRFTVVRWGALASLEEAPEHYASPIDLAYVINEAWTTQIEAPRLKRIDFRPRQMGL